MALYRLRAVIAQDSGLPVDYVTWSWGVEAPSVDQADLEGLVAPFIAALQVGTSQQTMRAVTRSNHRILGLEAYPAAGGPAVALAPVNSPLGQGSFNALPPQVAMAVNAQIDTNRGVKPLGRTFYGPFISSQVTADGRPTNNVIAAVLNFAGAWHTAQLAAGLVPVVLAKSGLVHRGAVVSYSCDNRYDTMRSRAPAPTQLSGVTP